MKQYKKLAPSYNSRFPSYLQVTTGKIAATANIMPDDRVLDLGCGTGELLFTLAQKFPAANEFVGIDLSEEMLKLAKSKLDAFKAVSLRSGNIEQIPYPDASFDLIVSSGVLHYVRNPKTMMREALRVLKPRGRLLLIDMAQESLTTKISSMFRRIADPGAVQYFSLHSVSALLGSQGFKILSSELFSAGIFGLYLIEGEKMDGTITCPNCGKESHAPIPTDQCQYFYLCPNCQARLRPKMNDCCVFCSYGDRKCPTAHTSAESQ